MTNTDDEIELNLKRLQAEKKRQGIFILILAAVMAAVVMSGVYLYFQFETEQDRTQTRDARIGNLESALDAQRQQFLNCQDKPPTATGCAEPVAPSSGSIPGPEGPAGTQGLPGVDGVDGRDGSQGPRGRAGRDGQPGTDGEDGVNGTDGEDGTDGAQGPPGPQGPQGETGPQGPQGNQGPAGPEGPAGPNCREGQQYESVMIEDTSTPDPNDTRVIFACVPSQAAEG